MDSQGGEIFETGRSGTIAQMSVRVGLKVAGLLAIDEGYERIPVISCDHFGSQCGAVTFVQRYGDALNANPHFHCLCIDGVYAAGSDGRPEFHQLPAPEDEDVLRLTTTILCQRSILLEASRPWTRSGSATGRSFVAE